MSRFFPLTRVLTVAILGFAGFVVFRSGWIPLEFGGTETGSVIDIDVQSRGVNSGDTGVIPDFEPDDSAPQFDVCGIPNGARTDSQASGAASAPRFSEDNEITGELTPPRSPIGSQALRAPRLRVLPEEDEPASDEVIQPAVAQRASGRPRQTLQLVAQEVPVTAETLEKKPTSDNIEVPADLPPEPSSIESLSEPAVRIAKKPDDKESAIDLDSIDRQFREGKLVEAHKALSKIYWQQPDQRTRIQERIDASAKAIYFSPQRHIQDPYVVQSGDQLRKIAVKHHVPWQFLAKLNRTDPKRLREGQKLKVIDGPFGAVVTLSDFELVVHHNGQYVRGYRACIGKDGSSPVGKFKILNKVANPQYTDPDGKVFSGTDPKNPLGKFWLDLGESYGIHGTIEPNSIGKAESRGCIRLMNDDVAEVYDILDVGSEVIIR